MSSPYSDGVVKRLNFGAGPSLSSPVSTLYAARRGPAPPRASPGGLGTPGSVHAGPVRYGLPEEELYGTDRRSVSRQSVSYRVPSDDGLSDDDVTSAPTAAQPGAVSRPDAVEEQRRLVEQQMLASLEAMHSTKQASWRMRLAEVEAQLAAKLNLVASTALRKQDDLAREDQEQLRAAQQKRNEELEKVQRTHRTEATLQEQQIKRLMEQREEERRKEEERRRREEEERRREAERQEAERERRRKEEEAAKARTAQEEEDRKRREAEADKQRQEAEAKAKKEAASVSAKAHPCLRVSPAAADAAEQLAHRLVELQAAAKPLMDDEGAKKQRRDIEKKLTVHVQQISGTVNQVSIKCQDVYNLMSGLQPGPWRTFAVLTFANKVIKQHELVQLNNKAAFPLSLVVVKVSQYFPELLDALLALIQKSVPLAIPRAYVHDPARITNNAYYRGMGFEEQADASAPTGKVFESPDEYIKRAEGLMLLYGAIMQVDEPNRFGVAQAWSWLARCLNQLPPDRYSAKALVAVLRVAGYALFMKYRSQFVKVLTAMRREYLPVLRATAGSDDIIGALATLLESYVADEVFRRPPEGRNMPTFDISSRAENRA